MKILETRIGDKKINFLFIEICPGNMLYNKTKKRQKQKFASIIKLLANFQTLKF